MGLGWLSHLHRRLAAVPSDPTHKLLLSLCFMVVKGVDVEKNEFVGETTLINFAAFFTMNVAEDVFGP